MLGALDEGGIIPRLLQVRPLPPLWAGKGAGRLRADRPWRQIRVHGLHERRHRARGLPAGAAAAAPCTRDRGKGLVVAERTLMLGRRRESRRMEGGGSAWRERFECLEAPREVIHLGTFARAAAVRIHFALDSAADAATPQCPSLAPYLVPCLAPHLPFAGPRSTDDLNRVCGQGAVRAGTLGRRHQLMDTCWVAAPRTRPGCTCRASCGRRARRAR